MKIMVCSVLLILIGLGYCSHFRKQDPLVGNYNLQGHDYSGRLIFNGTISMTSFENTELKGTCKVMQVETTFEGAVNKNGPCEGKISDDKIMLNLAPNLSDGGLVFEGNWSEGRIVGTWRIESMLGAKTLGTFEAVKQ
jgi:hypothetical protein